MNNLKGSRFAFLASLLILVILSAVVGGAYAGKLEGEHSTLDCVDCHQGAHTPETVNQTTSCGGASCHSSVYIELSGSKHNALLTNTPLPSRSVEYPSATLATPTPNYCTTCHYPHSPDWLWDLARTNENWYNWSDPSVNYSNLCYQCHSLSEYTREEMGRIAARGVHKPAPRKPPVALPLLRIWWVYISIATAIVVPTAFVLITKKVARKRLLRALGVSAMRIGGAMEQGVPHDLVSFLYLVIVGLAAIGVGFFMRGTLWISAVFLFVGIGLLIAISSLPIRTKSRE